MKRVFVSVLLLASFSHAGHIDYLGGRSADYFMAVARNAAVDGADLVTYNPAGLVHLAEGFHVNASGQFIAKDYVITAVPLGSTEETEYQTTKPTPFLPNVYAVYRTGDLAAFGAFTIPAGGGTLEYEDGLPIMPVLQTGLVQYQYGPGYIATMTDGYIEAGAAYYAGTVGAAYAFTPTLSASLAGRFTSGVRDYEASADFAIVDLASGTVVGSTEAVLECTRKASGMAGIMGVDFMPARGVNVAVRFETATPLEWEAETAQNTWAMLIPELADGALQRRDLPAVLGMGMQFQVKPTVTLGVMGNYYFTGAADQGEEDGLSDDYEDGWEAGTSVQWKAGSRFEIGLGYLYSDLGGSSETFTDFEYMVNYGMLGGGVRYAASENVGLVFSAANAFLEDGEGTGNYAGHQYEKKVAFINLGVTAGF
jgi:long-chain fatty acid transport protein